MSRLPARVTLRYIEKLLSEIGFSELRTAGKHIVFQHRQTGTRVILPRVRYVEIAHLSQIRRVLDETDILSKEEFDQTLVEEIFRRSD